jgi:hypothetical protein
VRVRDSFGVICGQGEGHFFFEGRGEEASGKVDAVALWGLSEVRWIVARGTYTCATGVGEGCEGVRERLDGEDDAVHHVDVCGGFLFGVFVFFERCGFN